MMQIRIFSSLIFSMLFLLSTYGKNSRQVWLLDTDWRFINKDIDNGADPSLNAADWQTVEVPHDWAINGPFDMNNDMQLVKVIEDGDTIARKRVGRTGGLPHVGVGWYRKTFTIPSGKKGKKVFVEFDGAMSHAKVYLNGEYIGEWPYGYSSFGFELTDKINFGKENILSVRLENKNNSSRWYPGAGIYRNVRLVVVHPVHVKQWGTYITTPDIKRNKGTVNISTTLNGFKAFNAKTTLTTQIFDQRDKLVAENTITPSQAVSEQRLTVLNPQLWSIDKPLMYKVITLVKENGNPVDQYVSTFGFRFVEFTADKGFFLNGKNLKLQGVCMHHDLGALGAAVNTSAIERQLIMLKEMGTNAIRTSHNPPTPELLDLCDKMGFLVIVEAFDEWKTGKSKNGYNTLWDKWAEKDLVAMIHRDRNHPSVILWSIGNEIREQDHDDGAVICKFLVDICKREDPTRLTTAGFDKWQGAIKNGLAAIVDVPGWNYKPQLYNTFHKQFPHWKMYGSETASTVSSRGDYFFPAEVKIMYQREPHRCSSYDLEYPFWATTPDMEFAAQDSFPYMAGEFVWTGFDYLGEPTPYYDSWPSRSSYFGIVDLAGIPKDRYYLYQSKWTTKKVLHLLPHWNWEGMEGKPIPVHCYTNYYKAELFVNGKSMGVREKNPNELYEKYRLVWNEVPYQKGELKVVALDENNKPLQETIIKTAGKPSKIVLTSNRKESSFSGKELVYITATIVDKDGVVCPLAKNRIQFKTTTEGSILATDNGDATSLESFGSSSREAYNGYCIAIVKPVKTKGEITITATAEELTSSSISVKLKK